MSKKCKIIKKIPYRVIIYLLEFYKFQQLNYPYSKIHYLFYGYFKLDRFRHIFLIFKSIRIEYWLDLKYITYFLPLKIKNIIINVYDRRTIRYIICEDLKKFKNIDQLDIRYSILISIDDSDNDKWIKYNGKKINSVNKVYVKGLEELKYKPLEKVETCSEEVIIKSYYDYTEEDKRCKIIEIRKLYPNIIKLKIN